MHKRISDTCTCGTEAYTNGIKTLRDGTRKRRFKCRGCGEHWMVVLSGPGAQSKPRTARYSGLWMHWRGYRYSPEEQARIRESVQMGDR
jgi:transposase-like protein